MDAEAFWSAAAAAVVAAGFAAVVLARPTPRAHDVLWGAGLALYALASGLEASAAYGGWSSWGYRVYFASAALLVGFLGLGTVALLHRPRLALGGGMLLGALAAVVVGGVAAADLGPLTGGVDVGADAVPFPHPARVAFLLLNVLGGVVLVVGAFASWWAHRRPGVLLIAVGALLPFAGGAASTLGLAASRVVLQLAGVALMFVGFLVGRAAAREAVRFRVPEARP